jgi:lysine biosynthesis protein LysW
MTKVLCPECKHRIDSDPRIEVGDEVTCSRCGAEWKVVSRSPLVLDWCDGAYQSYAAERLGLRYPRIGEVPMRRLWPTGG